MKTFVPDNCTGWRHEVIPDDHPDCPYLERWLVGVGPSMFRRSTEKSPKAWFTLRLHHFFRSDEDHLHDHGWWFVTLVLRGSYEDWIECSRCEGRGGREHVECVEMHAWEGGFHRMPATRKTPCRYCNGSGQVLGTRMRPGTVRLRPALHRHRVVTEGCWTLVVSGPKVRDWGFWTSEGWMRQRAYFRKYGGRAACE